jgi:hypothetical protein
MIERLAFASSFIVFVMMLVFVRDQGNTLVALLFSFVSALATYGLSAVFIGFIADGLKRARERAYLHPKVKAGTLKEADLPAALVRFPARSIAITFMLYASIPLLLYGSMVIEDLWLIFAAIWVGLPIILVGVSFFTLFKLVLWIFMHTGETAFTAAEALRRRKLKETIYADSNGDPLEVSDLRGDVSVGNDGEIEMGVRGKYDDGST